MLLRPVGPYLTCLVCAACGLKSDHRVGGDVYLYNGSARDTVSNIADSKRPIGEPLMWVTQL